MVELCAEEYGWTKAETNTTIEAAKEHSIIAEVTSSNHKKSYRVANQNVVKIQQNDQPICLGLNSNDADDFVEFKKFIHSEILSLKAQVTHKIQSPVKEPEPKQETDYVKDLIRSLQDRIVSLERQLQQKQWIIQKLLNGPKENVNKQEQQSQTHNCAPKGAERGCSIANGNKGDNKSTVETKVRERSLSDGEIRIPGSNRNEQVKKRESNNNKGSQKHQERRRITIIGDSILNGIDENSMKRHHNVQVRAHSGANTNDIKDHIKPILRRTPDCIIIHAGTNDLTRETDTINNLKSIVRDAKETAPTTEIVISSLAPRYDKANINQKVIQLNKEICALAKDMNIKVITHPNLDKSCLSKNCYI